MAVTTGETVAKEDTILGLTKNIGESLVILQSRLDIYFNRIDKGSVGEDRPQCPNILDEIIERLSDNLTHLSKLTSFISSEVLAKIDN